MKKYSQEEISEAYHVASIRAFRKGDERLTSFYAHRARNFTFTGSKPDRIVANYVIDKMRQATVQATLKESYLASVVHSQHTYEVDVTLKESMGIFKGVDDCEYPLLEIANRLSDAYKIFFIGKNFHNLDQNTDALIAKGLFLSGLPNIYDVCTDKHERNNIQQRCFRTQQYLKSNLIFEGGLDRAIFTKFCNLRVRT